MGSEASGGGIQGFLLVGFLAKLEADAAILPLRSHEAAGVW